MALSVATRLVVLDEPVFCNEKLTVTRSAGSIAPFVQLSAVSALPLMTNWFGTTVSTALELLFARFGSGTPPDTAAMLV